MTPELKTKLFWLNNKSLPYLLIILTVELMVILQQTTGVFVK